jgi:hypothetical protein
MKHFTENKIHPVYFSCSQHFDYLRASLASLDKLNSKYIGKVYLYIDKNDFLSREQATQLRNKLSLNVNLRQTENKMSWAGTNVIQNELIAFKEISAEILENDYLAKVDSDALFISDKIFKQVLKSDALFVGNKTPFWEPLIYYAQGGCYFLKKPLISKISFNSDVIAQTINLLHASQKQKGKKLDTKCPEDAAIFNLVKRVTDEIKFMNYFVALKHVLEINNSYDINSLRIAGKSVIHFPGSCPEYQKKMMDIFSLLNKENLADSILHLSRLCYRKIRDILRGMLNSILHKC